MLGTLLHRDFHSPALGERRGYVVYLPQAHVSGRRFPTLYLLHGALDWERTWVEKGHVVDALERAGHETIVVMPADNGGLHRGDTRVADYLARDVVGHVDFEYPTIADRRARALDGLSTGGFTSLVVGAWRPGVFASVGSMSGSHDPRSFEAISACAGEMRGRQRHVVSGGHGEPNLETSRAIARALVEHGVEASFVDAPGGHDWPLWRAVLPAHLAFHRATFQA